MVIKVASQTLTPSFLLLSNTKKDIGKINIITWLAIFLLAKVEPGIADWVKVNGSNKYWRIPIVAIIPAATIRLQVNLFRLEWFKFKLRLTKKLNNADSQSNHLFSALSKFKLHIKLKVPKTNKVSKDILTGFNFISMFSCGFLKIKNIISRRLIPIPEKYVLTSSWFEIVRLNQGEARATDIKKNPIIKNYPATNLQEVTKKSISKLSVENKLKQLFEKNLLKLYKNK